MKVCLEPNVDKFRPWINKYIGLTSYLKTCTKHCGDAHVVFQKVMLYFKL